MALPASRYWQARQSETLTIDDFTLMSETVAAPEVAQLLVCTRFLSLDPYLARAMRTGVGDAVGWSNGIVHGRIVAEVAASEAEGFAPGDLVIGVGRWQDIQTIDAAALERVPPGMDRPSLLLGVLGRSGITAWVGLHLADPRAGETLLISAASGAVGSVVGQLAKARGLNVVGIAGGPEKCAHVERRLGFPCLDHRLPDLANRIAATAPAGVDILFENVGGAVLDAALASMSQGGRIMLCGLAAHYNDERPLTLSNFKALLYRGLTLRGFVTAEHPDLFAPALAELEEGVASGAISHEETVIDGLENAPGAFLAMLAGTGLGKRLVRL